MKTSSFPSFRLGLITALALSGAAQAATLTMPAELPPFGKDKPLAVPNITQQTLPNGLQVWVVPRKGIPRVDFVLAVRGAGFGADSPDAPGRAKLLAGLLSEGTAKLSSRQIAEAAQAMGGSVGASASNDGISVLGNALASHAGAMAQLLADVARRPAFPDGEVQLAKINALQGLKASSTQPAFRAAKALDAAIYGAHAYGRTQETEAAIQAVTPETLRAEHAQALSPGPSAAGHHRAHRQHTGAQARPRGLRRLEGQRRNSGRTHRARRHDARAAPAAGAPRQRAGHAATGPPRHGCQRRRAGRAAPDQHHPRARASPAASTRICARKRAIPMAPARAVCPGA